MAEEREQAARDSRERKDRAAAVWCVFWFAAGSAIPFTTDQAASGVLAVFTVSAAFYGLLAATWLRSRPPFRISAENRLRKGERFIRRIDALTDRRYLISVWISFLVLWLPVYLALYPGTFGYDAPYQLGMYTGSSAWSAQHPILHTLMLGFLVEDVGRLHLGSSIRGLALYSAVQAAVTAYAIARSFLFMRKTGVPRPVRLGGWIWLAFNPFMQVLVFASTKDILFGSFLLLFATDFAEAHRAEHPSRGRCLRALASGTLMCLFRNQGVYMLLAALFLMLLVFRRRIVRRGRLRLAGLLLAAALLAEASSAAMAAAVHAEKGNLREMLSVPMQQLACAAYQQTEGKSRALTGRELKAIEKLIPEEGIRRYTPSIADPVKETFRTEVFLADPGRFIRLYFRIGFRCPGLYARAFWAMAAPFWDMSQNTFRYLSMQATPDPVTTWRDLGAHSRFPLLRDFLYGAVVTDDTARLPVIGLLYEPGLVLTLLLAAFGVSLTRRKERPALMLLLYILYAATMLLGPVALLRYLWPVMLAAPLIAGSQSGTFSEGEADHSKHF